MNDLWLSPHGAFLKRFPPLLAPPEIVFDPSLMNSHLLPLLPNIFHLICNYMYKCIPGRLELTWGQGRVFPVFVSHPALGLGFPLPDSPWRQTSRLDHYGWCLGLCSHAGCPGGPAVKNLPAVQEMQVRSLGPEDPLEEGMATHLSVLAWRIPWIQLKRQSTHTCPMHLKFSLTSPAGPSPSPSIQLCFPYPFQLVASSFSLHPPSLGPSLLPLSYTFPWSSLSKASEQVSLCPLPKSPLVLPSVPCVQSWGCCHVGPCTLRTPAGLLWSPTPPCLDSSGFFL